MLKLRRRPEVVRAIGGVYLKEPFLGKALALGYKVLTEKGYPRFERLVLSGQFGEAGAYALVVAKSPVALKFGNWDAPRGGFKEMVKVLEVLMPHGDLGAVEGALRLKTEGDEAEVLLLLELVEAGESPETIAGVVRAMLAHLPLDRKLQGSKVVPPVVEKKRENAEVKEAT